MTTTKTIILSEGKKKEMTFEEVLEQFDDMLHKYANDSIQKVVFNKPEKDDVMQELRVQTWEAYKRYNGDNAFSTYLVYRLKLGVGNATTKMYAQKRTNTHGSISLNELFSESDDFEFGGLLGEEDYNIQSLAFRDFVNYLEKILNPLEKKMLYLLTNKHEYSVSDLAVELGISRQAVNKKVVRFREKLEKIMKQTGYVA